MIMNDDTLLLYYYDDGLTAAERTAIRAALETDADLRQRYARLCKELAHFDARDTDALRPDMLARLHDSIDRAARLEQQHAAPARQKTHWAPFAWASMVAAALVLGIAIGVYVQDERLPVEAISVAQEPGNTAPALSVAFERGLQVHLRETREGLSTQPANANRAAIALQLVQQNRLFERAAEQHDSRDLARVLRAFEPILLRLAEDDISEREAEALQAQLAFELNVMLTKLGRNVSEETGPI
jgi:anti-sigma factor RsiW